MSRAQVEQDYQAALRVPRPCMPVVVVAVRGKLRLLLLPEVAVEVVRAVLGQPSTAGTVRQIRAAVAAAVAVKGASGQAMVATAAMGLSWFGIDCEHLRGEG
jgi:hypothetical protein